MPHHSDAFLCLVLDSLVHPFYVFQANDYKVVYANAAAGGFEALGQPCYALAHGRAHPCDPREHPCPLDTLRRTRAPAVVEHEHRTPDGERRTFEVHAHPILQSDGEVEQVIEYTIDVTEKKALQAQLAHADRLVTMGTLAAGIAHELRSPLAYTGGNLEVAREILGGMKSSGEAREGAEDVAELQAILADALAGVRRMTETIDSIRRFARQADTDDDTVDLKAVIETALRIARSEIKYKARIDLDLPELPLVRGSEQALGQVFLNLLVNAAHATPAGDPDSHPLFVRGREEGGEVIVEVEDSGSGIAPEHLERIFDAFFTTKPPEIGTGLGLHLCRQIVEAHGGSITVDSKLGEGTTFRVRLPVGGSEQTYSDTAAA